MADGTVRIDIKADAGDANKTVDGLNSKLSGIESAGTKGSLGIGKIVTALGLVKIASGAMNLLKSSLDGAISRYDTMNNFPRIMEQLGFSTDESTAAIDKLSDGVSGLPTPLNEIVKSAQGIALMTGDLDGATDTALALNNAFLSSGSSAADSSRGLQQYVQMLSRGEVDMQSWRTLQETMGVALNETAEAFGFTGQSAQNDLYAALKDGSITFDQFNAKIVELDGGVNGFAVRAKTASAGIATAFANMRTAVVRGLEGIIRSVDDTLANMGLPSIQQGIEAFGSGFETVLKGIASGIPTVASGIKSFFDIFSGGESIFGTFINHLNRLKTSVSESASSIVASVTERLPAIKETFSNTFSGLEPIISTIGGIIRTWGGIIGEVLEVVIPLAIDRFLIGWSFLSDAILPIIDTILDAFWDFSFVISGVIMNTVLPALQSFGDWMNDNQGVVKAWLAVIVGVVAAFKTYQGVMAIAKGAMMAFSVATKIVAGAQTLLNAAMNLNPIGLLIAAVVGLIAIFVVLWNTNEGFRNFFINAWNMIKTIFVAYWTIMSGAAIAAWEWIKTTWSAAGTWFTTTWDSIKQGAITLWQGVTEAWSTFVESIKLMWDGVKLFFVNLWTGIKDAAIAGWGLLVSGIMMIVSPFILGITNIFNALLPGIQLIWDGIKMAAVAAWELIKIAVLTPILILVDLITGDFEGMKSHLTQIWDNIKMYAGQIWQGMATVVMGIVTAWVGFLTLMWNGLKNITSTVFNAIKTGAINSWNATKNGVINAANALKQGAINAWNNLKTGVINAGEALKQGAINAWNALKSGVINAANAVKSGAVNAWNSLKSSVINLANSAKQGAISAWNSLKSSTSSIFNSVVSSIKSILKIDLRQIGVNIIQGLIGGIGSMIGKVKDKITEVANGIKDKITGALNIHSPSRWMRDNVGRYIPQGIAVGIEADTKKATKAMSNMASQLMMPKLTAESAMGIGNRMSTSPSSLMNTTKNTTVTNDNSMAVHIGNVENNSDSDIPKILEEAAWIMSRDKRRLGYE